MAIVKANYTRSIKAIKASVDYIAHRREKDGKEGSRKLFGFDGEMDKEQAYKMIDEARNGIVFFRIIISPDPNSEDQGKSLDLWKVTEQTMLQMERQLKKQVQFIAAEHGNTGVRHIHAIVLVPGRLTVADLLALQQAATEASVPTRQHALEQGFQAQEQPIGEPPASEQQSQARPAPTPHSCPSCGPGQPLTRLPGGLYRCPGCQLVLSQGQGSERGDLQLQLSQ